MIINEQNKDRVLNNNYKIKKGFNQTPADITERIYRDLKNVNDRNKQNIVNTDIKKDYDPMKHKSAIDNLNRINKNI